jgi:glutathione S-transferase
MSVTTAPYTLYGAAFSYYSGKTRSYLRHKRIPYVEVPAAAWIYLGLMPRKVGAAVVPVVHTPDGRWLQDSSVIMDELERRFPSPSATPVTPVLRFAAALFELWGDEFLLPLAMHTRWNRPEHLPWYAQEAGAVLLPGWPRFAQRWMGRQIANGMRGHVQTLGFGADMAPVLDRFGQIQLDALDAHFAVSPFLFGGRPSIGDFGLIGPLYAHIGRDPLSRRDLIDTRPHLRDWIGRMVEPAGWSGSQRGAQADGQTRSAADSRTGSKSDVQMDGQFRADDRVPATLLPALRSIFDEMVPYLAECADAVRHTPVLPVTARKAPRFLAPVHYPMAGGTHTRAAASYPVWMAQRVLALFHAMPAADRQTVRAWLDEVGGQGMLALDLPPVTRIGLAAAHTLR